MPTNLPPEAKDKWAEVEDTHNPKAKLQRMQEFLSLVPQHKGTMKLRGQVKKKMAVLRKELEERKQKRAGRGGPKFFIETCEIINCVNCKYTKIRYFTKNGLCPKDRSRLDV